MFASFANQTPSSRHLLGFLGEEHVFVFSKGRNLITLSETFTVELNHELEQEIDQICTSFDNQVCARCSDRLYVLNWFADEFKLNATCTVENVENIAFTGADVVLVQRQDENMLQLQIIFFDSETTCRTTAKFDIDFVVDEFQCIETKKFRFFAIKSGKTMKVLRIDKITHNLRRFNLDGIGGVKTFRWSRVDDQVILITLTELGHVIVWKNSPQSSREFFQLNPSTQLMQEKYGTFCVLESAQNDLEELRQPKIPLKKHLWLLTTSESGQVAVWFIEDCYNPFISTCKGIQFVEQTLAKSLHRGTILDIRCEALLMDAKKEETPVPIQITMKAFFDTGVVSEYSFDLNAKHLSIKRQLGGFPTGNVTLSKHVAHPLLAALSDEGVLSIVEGKSLSSLRSFINAGSEYLLAYREVDILCCDWNDDRHDHLVALRRDADNIKLQVFKHEENRGWYISLEYTLPQEKTTSDPIALLVRSYDEGSIVLVVTGSYVDAYQIADEEVMYVSRFVSVEDDKKIEACAVVSIDPVVIVVTYESEECEVLTGDFNHIACEMSPEFPNFCYGTPQICVGEYGTWFAIFSNGFVRMNRKNDSNKFLVTYEKELSIKFCCIHPITGVFITADKTIFSVCFHFPNRNDGQEGMEMKYLRHIFEFGNDIDWTKAIIDLEFLTENTLLILCEGTHYLFKMDFTHELQSFGLPFYHPQSLLEDLRRENLQKYRSCLAHLLDYLEEPTTQLALSFEELIDTENALSVYDQNELIDKLEELEYMNGTIPNLTQEEVKLLKQLVEQFDGQPNKDDVALSVFLTSIHMCPDTSLPSWSYAWAYHSDAETSMLDFARQKHGAITWKRFNDMGVGFWLEPLKLKQSVFKMAMDTFKADKELNDVMIWFLCLNRKQLLVGLLKSDPMRKNHAKFFEKDFSIEANKRVAMKNAYSARSKQKFLGAATFFILAGDYEGALEIVVKRMKEVHMGVILLKLLYNPNENKEEFQRVLKEKILDNTADPFLRHILYFDLDEPEESVEVLYDENVPLPYAAEVKYFCDFLVSKAPKIKAPQQTQVFQSSIFAGFGMPKKPPTQTKVETTNSYSKTKTVLDDRDKRRIDVLAMKHYQSSGLHVHALELLLNQLHCYTPEEKQSLAFAFLSTQASLVNKVSSVDSALFQEHSKLSRALGISVEKLLDHTAQFCRYFGHVKCLMTLQPSKEDLGLMALNAEVERLWNLTLSDKTLSAKEADETFDRWTTYYNRLLVPQNLQDICKAVSCLLHAIFFHQVFLNKRYSLLEYMFAARQFDVTLDCLNFWRVHEKNDEKLQSDEDIAEKIESAIDMRLQHVHELGQVALDFLCVDRFVTGWLNLAKGVKHQEFLQPLASLLNYQLSSMFRKLHLSYERVIFWCIDQITHRSTRNDIERLLVPLAETIQDINPAFELVNGRKHFEFLRLSITEFYMDLVQLQNLRFHSPRELYKSTSLPRTFCINKSQVELVAIGAEEGIRELNIHSSLKYRERSKDDACLMDMEFRDFSDVSNRFKGLEDFDLEDHIDCSICPSKTAKFLFTELQQKRPSLQVRSGTPPAASTAATEKTLEQMKEQKTVKNLLPPQPPRLGNPASNFVDGYPSHKLHIPLYKLRDQIPSLQKLRNEEWKPYRFYQRVVETQSFESSEEFRDRLPYALASHPKLPLYIASFGDLRIKLFMFNHEQPLASFLVNSRRKKRKVVPIKLTSDGKSSSSHLSSESKAPSTPISSGQAESMRFNRKGNKVAAIFDKGHVNIWHFNVPRSIDRREFKPFVTRDCHDVTGSGLSFLDGSTRIATAGRSDNDQNICIWDFLRSNREHSLVRGYAVMTGKGALSVEACGPNLMFGGGFGGKMCMLDPRIANPVKTWESGGSRLHRLHFCPETNEIAAGSWDGIIRVWDIRKLKEGKNPDSVKSVEMTVYSRKTFFKTTIGMLSTVGLTDVQWTPEGHLLCCGSDGSLKFLKRKFKTLEDNLDMPHLKSYI